MCGMVNLSMPASAWLMQTSTVSYTRYYIKAETKHLEDEGRLFNVNWSLWHWASVNQQQDEASSWAPWSLSAMASTYQNREQLGKIAEEKSEKKRHLDERHLLVTCIQLIRVIFDNFLPFIWTRYLFFIFKQCLTLFQIFLEEHSVLSSLMTNSYWWLTISGKTHMGNKGFQYFLCEYHECLSYFPSHRIWD